MSEARALRPFFSFFGSKWSMAPKYPEPRHGTIVEPFAGSAGYSLRYSDREVILVERDPVVSGIWKWLVTADKDDFLSMPSLRYGESLRDYNLPPVVKDLMGFWVGQSQWSPCFKVTKFADPSRPAGGMSCEKYIRRCIDQVSYIRHWRIIQGHYYEAPDIRSTWFIDPPYQVAGKKYKFGSSQIDYPKLAEWCRDRDGQVMVCENEGADWLPFSHFHTQTGSTYKGVRRLSKEVMWSKS